MHDYLPSSCAIDGSHRASVALDYRNFANYCIIVIGSAVDSGPSEVELVESWNDSTAAASAGNDYYSDRTICCYNHCSDSPSSMSSLSICAFASCLWIHSTCY